MDRQLFSPYPFSIIRLTIENGKITTPPISMRLAFSGVALWGRIQKKHGVWDPMPEFELTITSPNVHSRVDFNTFTMGNPMPESALSLSQGLWIWPQNLFGFCKYQKKEKKDDLAPVLFLLLGAPDLRQGRRAHASRVMSLPKVVLFPSCNNRPIRKLAWLYHWPMREHVREADQAPVLRWEGRRDILIDSGNIQLRISLCYILFVESNRFRGQKLDSFLGQTSDMISDSFL